MHDPLLKTRVLGVDQSQTNAGLAVVDLYTHMYPHLIKTGIEEYLVRPDRKKKVAEPREKQRRFKKHFLWYIETYEPDVVCTELVHSVYGVPNRNANTALSELQGIMNVETPEETLMVCENVGTWRSVLLPEGYTKNPKQAAIDFVYSIFGVVLDEHRAEAVCLCMAYPLLKDIDNRSKVEILR